MLDLLVLLCLLMVASFVVMWIQFNDIRTQLDQIEQYLDDGYQTVRIPDKDGQFITVRMTPTDYQRLTSR